MTQENQGTNSAVPDNLPVKRKRGRPRKDRSQAQGHVSATPTPDTEKNHQRRKIDPVVDTRKDMLGQAVYGVLDGSFDAGYLLTVRVGDTDTILKGVVFQPGSILPISVSNDVAPHMTMLKRAEVHIPQFDLPSHHMHGSSGQPLQMSKQLDEPLQKSEGIVQPGAYTPVNHVPMVPPDCSNSQSQIAKGGEGEANHVVEAVASVAIHHHAAGDKGKNSAAAPGDLDQGGLLQSELKDKSAEMSKDDAAATVKQAIVSVTTAASGENVPNTEVLAKMCAEDEAGKRVDAELEGQTKIASLPTHNMGGVEQQGGMSTGVVAPPSYVNNSAADGPDTHLSMGGQ